MQKTRQRDKEYISTVDDIFFFFKNYKKTLSHLFQVMRKVVESTGRDNQKQQLG